MIYLATLASVTLLGGVFGLGLALASRKFRVEEDPRIEKICTMLPGTNCGACGYAGCRQFAEAVVRLKDTPHSCRAGGRDVAAQVTAVMGFSPAGEPETLIPRLHCRGSKKYTSNRAAYRGIPSCAAADLVEGGFKACLYGCLGLGDCALACPFDAMMISKEGLPVVDKRLCTGCGRCARACPRNLLSLGKNNGIGSEGVQVLCCSPERGRAVQKACSVGCIACRRCVRACPSGAISMENNLPVIISARCNRCGTCVEECPKGVLLLAVRGVCGRVSPGGAGTGR